MEEELQKLCEEYDEVRQYSEELDRLLIEVDFNINKQQDLLDEDI